MVAPRNLIFMGSPAFAVPSLAALVGAGYTLDAIYTQPQRPAGRGQQLTPTAVHAWASAHVPTVPVRTPERLREAALGELLAEPANLLVVVAYGLLLPPALVNNKTCLNVHPSPLPRWRGPAPLQHTLLAGDTQSELCIMQLDAGMDTGPVLRREPLALDATTTYGELHDRAAHQGAQALLATLAAWPVVAIPQTGDATLAPKLGPADRQLDWQQSAVAVANRVRALSPKPGAQHTWQHESLKVLAATPSDEGHTMLPGTILAITAEGVCVACGSGSVWLHTLQRAGGKPLPAQLVASQLGWTVGTRWVA